MRISHSIKVLFTLIISFLAINVSAQILAPIKWDTEFIVGNDNTAKAVFKATIDDGWHLYALDLPEDGPVPTSIVWEEVNGV